MNATDRVSKYVPVRIIVVATAIWMTWLVSAWGMEFALGNPRDGLQIAAIIAAVTAPVTLFAGSVFKSYIESRTI